MTKEEYWRSGLLPILGASFIWGFYYFFAKILSQYLGPVEISFYISITAVICMIAFRRVNIERALVLFVKYRWHYLALSLAGTTGDLLLLFAIKRLDLGVCTLLEKLQPVFVIILAILFLKEHYSAKKLCYAVLAIGASYFIAVENPFLITFSEDQSLGILAIIGTAFFWALSSVIGRNVMKRKLEPVRVTLIRYTLGGGMLLPLIIWQGGLTIGEQPAVIVLQTMLLGVLGYEGYILYYKGLRHVPAGIAGLLELLTPIVALLLGFSFLGETLSDSQLAAIPLLLYTVWRISVPDNIFTKNTKPPD